jgi:hypothetical protein
MDAWGQITYRSCAGLAKLNLTVQIRRMRALLLILLTFVATTLAPAAELPSFKDDLFAYPSILEQTDNGRRLVIDYNEMRDINGRDIEPERRVKRNYISPKPKGAEKDVALDTAAGRVTFIATGRQQGASIIVVYLHGKGGDRRQGQNDNRFGGNFNRIRNLMLVAGGVYITPDFSDFADKGAGQVKSIIDAAVASSPGAPVYVACGSMGGFICHRLAADPEIGAKLSGMLLLGSFPDPNFQKSAFFKAKRPLFIGHGSRDKSSPVGEMEAFYASIRQTAPSYPVWLHRFETGAHGTPIRMTDWRLALNLMGQAN